MASLRLVVSFSLVDTSAAGFIRWELGPQLSSQLLCLVVTEGPLAWRSCCACGYKGRLICCALLLSASTLNTGPSPARWDPAAHCTGEHREEKRGSGDFAVASGGG